MRAFEMPPHARMSLAQQLLLRGLVAKFWNEPYKNNLVRWGTDIHDRWMLPHFCETDFSDVIGDLREAGYPFEFEWFAPHFEFRFPRIGDLEQRDLQIELRTALEPWHVLGEEPGGGGTVRYVDSSLERLQVKARGLIGDRFAITCNGHRVPLHPTGTNGEGVAGVRYRAWQPPDCLQPTIGIARAAAFRSLRHLERAFARRLHLSRRASGRTQLRHVSREQLRSREPAALALFPPRPHAGKIHAAAGNSERRISFHAGFAQRLMQTTIRADRDQPPMIQSQSQSATGETSFAKKATPEKLLAGYKRSDGRFRRIARGQRRDCVRITRN